MKICELLTEDIDIASWGSWISPDGIIYSIGTAGHATFMKQFYPKLKNEADIFVTSQAVADGWVHLLHDPKDNGIIGILGLPGPIKNAWRIIKKEILEEFRMLHITVLKSENSKWRVSSDYSKSFDILTNKSKINQFFNSLS